MINCETSFQGYTPRRSPRQPKIPLTPSTESFKSQLADAAVVSPAGKAKNVTPEKRKRSKVNQRELFKSLGLEDSNSCSNFGSESNESPVKAADVNVQSKDRSKKWSEFVEKSTKETAQAKASATGSKRDDKLSAPKSIFSEDTSDSGKERSLRKNLLFSPEPLKTTGRVEKSTASPTTARKKADSMSGENASTGLTLSKQILASYGILGSHTLEPATSNSVLKSPTCPKAPATSSGRRDKERQPSGKSSNLVRDEEASKRLSKTSKLAKTKNLPGTPESGKRKVMSKSPSASLLALCGLEDSPAKENDRGIKSVPDEKKKKLFVEARPETEGLSSESQKVFVGQTELKIKPVSAKEKSNEKQSKKKSKLSMSTQSLASFPSKDEPQNTPDPTKGDKEQLIERHDTKIQSTEIPEAAKDNQNTLPLAAKAETVVSQEASSSQTTSTAPKTLEPPMSGGKRKKKRSKLSFSSSILASCTPETETFNDEEVDTPKTSILSDSRNTENVVVTEVAPTSPAAKSPSTKRQSLRLSTPKKTLATSLGLDLSSSEDSGDEEGSMKKAQAASLKNIPEVFTVIQEALPTKEEGSQKIEKASKSGGRKKRKLGHSVKENYIEIVFNN